MSDTDPRLSFDLVGLERRFKRETRVALVLTASLSLGLIGLFLFSWSKQTEIARLEQEIVAIQDQAVSVNQASTFLNTQQDTIELLNDTFPNEATLIEFIQVIEALSVERASRHELRLSAQAPKGEGAQPYLPFTLSLSTDADNMYTLLTQLEKLPFLVEVVSMKGIQSDSSGIINYELQARVFVRDPFALQTTGLTIPVETP